MTAPNDDSPTLRLTGHELMNEGAPYEDNGRRKGWSGTGGTGRAKCGCGVLSDALPSGNARKQWHRDHKKSLVNGTAVVTSSILKPSGIWYCRKHFGSVNEDDAHDVNDECPWYEGGYDSKGNLLNPCDWTELLYEAAP